MFEMYEKELVFIKPFFVTFGFILIKSLFFLALNYENFFLLVNCM